MKGHMHYLYQALSVLIFFGVTTAAIAEEPVSGMYTAFGGPAGDKNAYRVIA